MCNRLPDNLQVIEKIKYLSPAECFNQFPKFSQLPIELSGCIDRDAIESQGRQLGSFNFNELITDTSINDISIAKFWIQLSQIMTAPGEYQFRELCQFALKIMSLPISNVVVERVFSVMNITKTKIRNRMGQQMLVALIRIKIHNQVKKICCTSFTPTAEMLKAFNTKMYDSDSSDNLQIANLHNEENEMLKFNRIIK
ncbi:uncharacterized protein LOC107882417 [Acyrthosiphon pisum]|uniref:HAT C-terminal dimerisation domain-containing protein n=1 Tax=Acyrthosiphon pisum TaxID=7029 RepID=A0A8R2D159_ACYPI|nr:uncharacterized protein LOC107882417 [Acyrthosiphon pisum]